MKNKYTSSFMVLFLALVSFIGTAQDNQSIISSYLAKNAPSLGLNSSDVSEFTITSATTLSNKEVKVVYLLQRINNVNVSGASATVVIKNGEVLSFKHGFVSDLSAKTDISSASLSPVQAVNSAANHLGLQGESNVMVTDYKSREDLLIENVTDTNYEAPLYYEISDNDRYILTYEVIVKDPKGAWWNAKVNASNGQLLNKVNMTITCNFDLPYETDAVINNHKSHSHTVEKNGQSNLVDSYSKISPFSASASSALVSDGAIYNAYPLRVESPLHGDRVILNDPSAVTPDLDGLVPSPFGWHDVDGMAGAEFTTTQGNNVSAYLDTMDNDAPTGPEVFVDGGANLLFDDEIDFSLEPSEYRPAVITNLFVWNNYMHDVWYNYGFDESSGNFQEANYGRFVDDGSLFGPDGDSVNAEAQDGSELAAPTLNNANMATSMDGSNPRMQMFLWGAAPFGDFLEVISPSDVEGSYFASRFPFVDIPRIEDGEDQIRANIIVVEDDGTPYLGDDGGTPGLSTESNDGCTAYLNAADIEGNIAIVRRGVCAFATKIRRAQNAGAIACIIVNNVEGEGPVNGGGTPDEPITIPAISVGQVQGDAIIAIVDGGGTVDGRVIDRGPLSATVMKDGDVDQGIIAHEYGHGISTRLVGGRDQSLCLLSLVVEEQMGEGWSDWFALVMTQELDDTAVQPRGIGTYVLGQDQLGSGIRPARYSTDFAVNDYTYGDLPNDEITVPHGVGFVWSTILWDMYWAFIDEYGFDADIYNGTGGNNMAMQLVIDGLKLLPCAQPGFVTGRDAILEADDLLYDGANECLIRKAFADRGVGALAIQGLANSRMDQIEDFTISDPLGTDCDAVLATNNVDNTIFSIYPNPSNGNININSNKNNGLAKVEMFDINGRRVLSTQIDLTNTGNVNATQLTTGIYVIKVSTDTSVHTQKLVIK